ncbi:MAG: hypothetical protein LCI00_29465 [Chloroflexi bacterium]|nr:hypothetical protein [Chloroflexota bacterium]MCC6893670.1 hypothetical protein [Anaerolineae bacterium]
MSHGKTATGNNMLLSLASTLVVGYLTTRFRFFRFMWRFMPLLVVVSAWFMNRQAETVSEQESDERVKEPAA